MLMTYIPGSRRIRDHAAKTESLRRNDTELHVELNISVLGLATRPSISSLGSSFPFLQDAIQCVDQFHKPIRIGLFNYSSAQLSPAVILCAAGHVRSFLSTPNRNA